MLFCSLLFLISMILLVISKEHSGDIEANPGPAPSYLNWNLDNIAVSLRCLLTLLRYLFCKVPAPYISLILSVYQKPF